MLQHIHDIYKFISIKLKQNVFPQYQSFEDENNCSNESLENRYELYHRLLRNRQSTIEPGMFMRCGRIATKF